MYDHTFYKQVQISGSDIRPHMKWAVSLVILHMVTSIFLQALCGYICGYIQWEGMGDVGSARYEPALLPPCPTIRVLSYSN